jgi:hypothetical protein
MPYIRVHDLQLHYEQEGTGVPLILIPYLEADNACETRTQIFSGRYSRTALGRPEPIRPARARCGERISRGTFACTGQNDTQPLHLPYQCHTICSREKCLF